MCVVGAVVAGSAGGATSLADPIVGTWKVTRGGSGAFTIVERSGVLALTATKSTNLACVSGAKDFVLGFIDLPSTTALPSGRYNGHLGEGGQGCAFSLALKLARRDFDRHGPLERERRAGRPVHVRQTSGASYRWSAKAGSIAGSGRLASTRAARSRP